MGEQQKQSLASEHPYFFEESSQDKEVNLPEGQISDFQEKFIRMLYLLALLVALMVAASMVLKKMMKTRVDQLNSGSLIQVIETRSLSTKSTLYLIEVEGKKMIITESQLKTETTTLQ